MGARRDGNRARTEAAWTWWNSLQTRPAAPSPPTRWLPAALTLAALTLAAAMPLGWHHLTAAAALVYRLPTAVSGLDDGSWLLLVAVVAVVLAIRNLAARPGLRSKWLISVLAFATVNGMVIDYIDWNSRGVSQYVRPYYGPGFFVAVGGAALLVLAAVLAWRVPE
jgi:hypothetical protein